MVGGVDLAGEVVADASGTYAPGAKVLATGYGIGETHWGGYAELARVCRPGGHVLVTAFHAAATRAGGKGRNPQTGEEITIKPSKQPRFRAGKQLKDSLN